MKERKDTYLGSLKDVVNKDNWKDDNTLVHRVSGMMQQELIDELEKLNVNYIAEILQNIPDEEYGEIGVGVFSFVYDNYFHTFELIYGDWGHNNEDSLLSGKRHLLV